MHNEFGVQLAPSAGVWLLASVSDVATVTITVSSEALTMRDTDRMLINPLVRNYFSTYRLYWNGLTRDNVVTHNCNFIFCRGDIHRDHIILVFILVTFVESVQNRV